MWPQMAILHLTRSSLLMIMIPATWDQLQKKIIFSPWDLIVVAEIHWSQAKLNGSNLSATSDNRHFIVNISCMHNVVGALAELKQSQMTNTHAYLKLRQTLPVPYQTPHALFAAGENLLSFYSPSALPECNHTTAKPKCDAPQIPEYQL